MDMSVSGHSAVPDGSQHPSSTRPAAPQPQKDPPGGLPELLDEYVWRGLPLHAGQCVYLQREPRLQAAWGQDQQAVCVMCHQGLGGSSDDLVECNRCLMLGHKVCRAHHPEAPWHLGGRDPLSDDCRPHEASASSLQRMCQHLLFSKPTSSVLQLARIVNIVKTLEGDGAITIGAQYYVLPEETPLGRDEAGRHTRELFLSVQVQPEPVTSICGLATVVPIVDLNKPMDPSPALRDRSDVFGCDHGFTAKFKAAFRLLPQAEVAAEAGRRVDAWWAKTCAMQHSGQGPAAKRASEGATDSKQAGRGLAAASSSRSLLTTPRGCSPRTPPCGDYSPAVLPCETSTAEAFEALTAVAVLAATCRAAAAAATAKADAAAVTHPAPASHDAADDSAASALLHLVGSNAGVAGPDAHPEAAAFVEQSDGRTPERPDAAADDGESDSDTESGGRTPDAAAAATLGPDPDGGAALPGAPTSRRSTPAPGSSSRRASLNGIYAALDAVPPSSAARAPDAAAAAALPEQAHMFQDAAPPAPPCVDLRARPDSPRHSTLLPPRSCGGVQHSPLLPNAPLNTTAEALARHSLGTKPLPSSLSSLLWLAAPPVAAAGTAGPSGCKALEAQDLLLAPGPSKPPACTSAGGCGANAGQVPNPVAAARHGALCRELREYLERNKRRAEESERQRCVRQRLDEQVTEGTLLAQQLRGQVAAAAKQASAAEAELVAERQARAAAEGRAAEQAVTAAAAAMVAQRNEAGLAAAVEAERQAKEAALQCAAALAADLTAERVGRRASNSV